MGVGLAQARTRGTPHLTAVQAWLDGERAIVTQHHVGVLHALCASRAFGAIFVDGGAFTGGAEWDIIQTHCGRVTWVALDDTHAKTAMMLATARAAPEAWEVVYEEWQQGQEVPSSAPASSGFARRPLVARHSQG